MTLKSETTLPETEANDATAPAQQTDAVVAEATEAEVLPEPPTAENIDDMVIDEAELEAALAETNETVTQATDEMAAAAAARGEPLKPKLTTSQEAAATSLNEMVGTLAKYDICRAAVEKIGTEMRDLRIALDSFEPGALIETTCAGIRVPMTASMVLEAKRAELARAMEYMHQLSVQMAERADAMTEASYLDLKVERMNDFMPPRRSSVRGPIIRERTEVRETEVDIDEGIASVLSESVPAMRDDDPIPQMFREPRREDEPKAGRLGQMLSGLRRNLG